MPVRCGPCIRTMATPIRAGYIYVAPPNHHLLIEADKVLVRRGPKENRFRPSVDALFRSAAYTFGPRVIGVVLTGLLDDGTSGMWSIKRMGGIGIIQEPQDALYPSMPESVLEYVDVDYIVPIAELGPLLVRLTDADTARTGSTGNGRRTQAGRNRSRNCVSTKCVQYGYLRTGRTLSPLTCPECSGVLVSIQEGQLIRYRCHTGHSYTAGTLLAEVTKNVEDTLWSSVRGLEEAVMLLDQSGRAFNDAGDSETAGKFFSKARETRRRSERLHEFIFQQDQFSDDSRSLEPEGVPAA